MSSTHPDRYILHSQIDLSECVVCVAKNADRSILHVQIELSGCIVCVAHSQIDLYYTYRSIWMCSVCSTHPDRSTLHVQIYLDV